MYNLTARLPSGVKFPVILRERPVFDTQVSGIDGLNTFAEVKWRPIAVQADLSSVLFQSFHFTMAGDIDGQLHWFGGCIALDANTIAFKSCLHV